MSVVTENKQQIKSYAIKGLLLCLGAAGLLGIWVLVLGTFGATEGKILSSTVLLGIFSALLLGHLALAGKRYEWLGIFGAISSAVFILIGLFLIWIWPESTFQSGELFLEFIKYMATSGIVAISSVHAGALLLLSQNRSRNVQIALAATLGAIALVALILIFMIFNEFGRIPDIIVRLLGVFAIVDVVGTVTAPVLARLSRSKKS